MEAIRFQLVANGWSTPQVDAAFAKTGQTTYLPSASAQTPLGNLEENKISGSSASIVTTSLSKQPGYKTVLIAVGITLLSLLVASIIVRFILIAVIRSSESTFNGLGGLALGLVLLTIGKIVTGILSMIITIVTFKRLKYLPKPIKTAILAYVLYIVLSFLLSGFTGGIYTLPFTAIYFYAAYFLLIKILSSKTP